MISILKLKNQRKSNKGITLIALVITIIVLLILAGISIATLTGENGVLTKASEAERKTDIEDTKEQIKIELMGAFDDKGNSYTNQDVINAVKKITGKETVENTEIIQTAKGNDVDISDLWKEKLVIYMKKLWTGSEYVEVPFKEGQVWNEEFLENLLANYGEEIEWKEYPNASTTSTARFRFREDGLLEISPDSYSFVGMYYGEDSMVYKGDLLSKNAHYQYKEID